MDIYIKMDFGYAYNLAGYIKNKIIENNPDNYILDFIDLDYDKTLKPHKETVLHNYIINELNEEIEYLGSKADYDELSIEWEGLMNTYEQKFKKQKNKNYDYINYLEKKIKKNIAPKIANETFQILFGDRIFCLKFNSIIADHIKKLELDDNESILKADGKVKRCSYFPTWTQKAIFLRDKGCCAICLNDLSGLIKTDFNKAIDHIVPLNLGGINDITNLQLLCKKCNDDKLGHTIKTSRFYPVYF